MHIRQLLINNRLIRIRQFSHPIRHRKRHILQLRQRLDHILQRPPIRMKQGIVEDALGGHGGVPGVYVVCVEGEDVEADGEVVEHGARGFGEEGEEEAPDEWEGGGVDAEGEVQRAEVGAGGDVGGADGLAGVWCDP